MLYQLGRNAAIARIIAARAAAAGGNGNDNGNGNDDDNGNAGAVLVYPTSQTTAALISAARATGNDAEPVTIATGTGAQEVSEVQINAETVAEAAAAGRATGWADTARRMAAAAEGVTTTPGVTSTAARPPSWPGGPIAGVSPTQGGKAGLLYRCIPAAAFSNLEQSDPQAARIIGAQVVAVASQSRPAEMALRAIQAGIVSGVVTHVNLEFVSGQLVGVKPAAGCTPTATAKPCPECKTCPTRPSWWWIVAIGVTGVWAGSRFNK